MNKKKETRLQIAIAHYCRLQYPGLMFTSESSGIKVPMGLAVQMKQQRSNHKWPDMFFAEPKGDYHGLFIELKKDYETLYTSSGQLRQSKHIQEQYSILKYLESKGYKAVFACGIDEAKNIIDRYMDQ